MPVFVRYWLLKHMWEKLVRHFHLQASTNAFRINMLFQTFLPDYDQRGEKDNPCVINHIVPSKRKFLG